jgi:DNA helicase-2/ATP-dependent DNA helicase PcrA
MIDFKNELNEEQLAVVLKGDGPCLVLAGAGSGKTRTITYRVAYLLERGINPENILLVTFTNKAAGEMIHRVQELSSRAKSREPSGISAGVPPLTSFGRNDKAMNILPWAGTFHSIANKILRYHAPVLGYQSNFTILDSDDSESLIKICLKKIAPQTNGGRFPSAGVLKNIISFARNAETTIEDVLDLKYPSWFCYSEEIRQIAEEYGKKKREANAMDFDDLLVNLLLLLNKPDSAQKYSSQFKYILVDEYQDTNRIQSNIVKKLAEVHKNLLVVGDDAQSIYSFRAANIENILNFEKDYPDAKIFKLETNYRSSQEILSLANNVIANNINQYQKNLRTIFESGTKPELRPQMDQSAEAEFVVKKINEALEAGILPKEIAVLFRASHHSQQLEMALARAGIAYDYRGGLRFFERAHIKDMLAYLRLMTNLADTTAWMRVLLKEEGIGTVAAEKIIEAVRQLSSRAKSREPSGISEGIPPLTSFGRNDIASIGYDILGERAKVGWNNFARIWEEMLNVGISHPAELIKAVLETGYNDYLEAEYIDSRERSADIKQLAVFAEKFDDLNEFLSETSLAENYRQATSPEPSSYKGEEEVKRPLLAKERNEVRSEKIILSTIHQAKGLEWNHVFIINLSSAGFPNGRALSERGGLEEERRLFYVALTRAKKFLFLTYPLQTGFSAQGGPSSGWGDMASGPSMFLEEIDPDLFKDYSLLPERSSLVLDDDDEISYVSEDEPIKITPGFLLRDIDDL